DGGGCPQPLKLCGAACVDVLKDPGNCGGCGVFCGAGTGCFNGTCAPTGGADGGAVKPPPDAGVSCGAGGLACGNQCVDAQNDRFNCGGCGISCTAADFCSQGKCQPGGSADGGTPPPPPPGDGGACPLPFKLCGAACIDVQHDINNCGNCGVV